MKIPTTAIKNIVPYIKHIEGNIYSVKLLLLLNNKWNSCFGMLRCPYMIKINKLKIIHKNNIFMISDIVIDRKTMTSNYVYDMSLISITYFKSNYMRNKIIKIIDKIILTDKKDISLMRIMTK